MVYKKILVVKLILNSGSDQLLLSLLIRGKFQLSEKFQFQLRLQLTEVCRFDYKFQL